MLADDISRGMRGFCSMQAVAADVGTRMCGIAPQADQSSLKETFLARVLKLKIKVSIESANTLFCLYPLPPSIPNIVCCFINVRGCFQI
ncbi:hypothetical protein CEXT_715741 [Caerostris extrusa]|uniref:Uncharacterized protein n=1 Tax=Caerostris extrusa TaxID=172846 RepID=A0AAV4RUJ9_CAEEX|nr:hypothetical protein CEXT_715741 [Caerostris extrusa]